MASFILNLLVLSILPMTYAAIFQLQQGYNDNRIPTAKDLNQYQGYKTTGFPPLSEIQQNKRLKNDKNMDNGPDKNIINQDRKYQSQIKSKQLPQQKSNTSYLYNIIQPQKNKSNQILIKQTEVPIKMTYKQFLKKYSCGFSSDQNNSDEFIFRNLMYQSNLKMINQHNSNPNRTYDMAVNCFIDDFSLKKHKYVSHNQEYERNRQVRRPPVKRNLQGSWQSYQKDLVNNKKVEKQKEKKEVLNPLNTVNQQILLQILQVDEQWGQWNQNYDYIRGLMGNARDQGSCHSCYAFAVVQSILISAKIQAQNNTLPGLSIQQIIDCGKGHDYTIYGCEGGNIFGTYDYVYQRKIGKEQIYPYSYYYLFGKKFQKQCNIETMNSPEYIESRFSIKNYRTILRNCNALKNALRYNTVTSSIQVTFPFRFYSGGIYIMRDKTNQQTFQHALTILGYNQQKMAYFVKNSWGTSWGIQGFGFIYQDIELCKYGAYAVFNY